MESKIMISIIISYITAKIVYYYEKRKNKKNYEPVKKK